MLKLLKLTTAAIFLFAAGACATTGGAITRFQSTPEGATVTIKGYGQCQTPCTAQINTPVSATIAKTGYIPQTFGVEPGRKNITVALELAAPTENVEETALPEL